MISIADPTFGQDELEAVGSVLADGMVADGPEVRRFEAAFAEFSAVEHGIATANGTAALHAALVGLGIGAGDRVVTTPFSFVASANAIRLAGATPVFADIDPDTFVLDPESVADTVDAVDADAILTVHLYGLPAALDALRDIADDAGAFLVEDAAQAHGARFDGAPVGSVGDVAAFSFYPTKNMSTGEGGMVLTDDEAVADRVRSYINHGRDGSDRYAHSRLGHNYRLTSLGAAIGRVQLDRLPAWVEARRRNARQLTAGLREVTAVEPPTEPDDAHHAYNQYTIRCPDREALASSLEAAGIETAVYYPTPIHELRAYEGFDADTPEAAAAASTVLSLPVHPGVGPASVERIVDAIRAHRSSSEDGR